MSQIVIESNMPTSCLDCPCRGFDGFGHNAYCTLSPMVEGTTEGRPQTCPIIAELPPHGRLIDADALQEHYEALDSDNGEYMESASETAETIANAPTILEANR